MVTAQCLHKWGVNEKLQTLRGFTTVTSHTRKSDLKQYTRSRSLGMLDLPEPVLLIPAVGVFTIVLLSLGSSGLTRSSEAPEMFWMVFVWILDGPRLVPCVFPKASVLVKEMLDALAVMLLFVSVLLRCGLGIIPGVFLQAVVLACDRPGSARGTVLPTSALVCGELPPEVFWTPSVFTLGGCSGTSGTL